MAVQFDEGPQARRRPDRYSFPTRMILRLGLAKTEGGAQIVLFIVAALCVVGAFFLFSRATVEPPAPSPAQVVL